MQDVKEKTSLSELAAERSRVLVVDDSEDVGELAVLALRPYYKADFAPSGAYALEMYRTAKCAGQPYALLLVDAAMPDMTGFELLQYLRQCEHDTETKIIIVTAHRGALGASRAEWLHADGYYQKPTAAGELLSIVADTLTGTTEGNENETNN